MAARHLTAVVDRPADEVWARLADFGAIASWAPQVDHSRLVTEGAAGIGAVRRVQSGRQTLLETVTAWEPRRLLGYRVAGLPAFIGDFTTTWELTKEGERQTRVTVRSELRQGLPRPIAALVLVRLKREGARLLQGLRAAVEAPTGAAR
jgi:carbon monoxide dehydrogenase subunit G